MTELETRLELLEQRAAWERQLIQDEAEAEREVAKARQRLAKIETEFEELKRERTLRKAKVTEARAVLAAIQRRRSLGPESLPVPEPDEQR